MTNIELIYKPLENGIFLCAMRKKDCKFLVGRNIDTHEERYFTPLEAQLQQKLLQEIKDKLIKDKAIIELTKKLADLLE